MMKKTLILLMAVLSLSACNRMRVRHDHSRQMQQVRVPVDTAQHNYVDELADEEVPQDEDLIVLPKDPEHGKAPANVDEQIERMMRGEDVDFGDE